MSAPTRRVTSATLSYGALVGRVPTAWTLILDCGHPTMRPIVRSVEADDFLRSPPKRVRCKTCERHALEATSRAAGGEPS